MFHLTRRVSIRVYQQKAHKAGVHTMGQGGVAYGDTKQAQKVHQAGVPEAAGQSVQTSHSLEHTAIAAVVGAIFPDFNKEISSSSSTAF